MNLKKSTQRAQPSLVKAAHYPNISWIPDLECQHGDPVPPPKINQILLVLLELSWKSPTLITCSFYHPGFLHKMSSQSIHTFVSQVDIKKVKQTIAISKEVILGDKKKFS